MRKIFFLILIFLTIVACSHLPVKSKRLSNKDFSSFQSYSFQSNNLIDTRGWSLNLIKLDELLRKNLSDVLKEKNYRYIDSDKPDILIGFQVVFEEKTNLDDTYKQLTADPFASGGGSIEDGSAIVQGLEAPRLNDYNHGDLNITISDAQSQELLWRGKAGLAIATILDYTELDQQLRKVLEKMFRKFPD